MIADKAGACQLRWEDVPLFGVTGNLVMPSSVTVNIYNKTLLDRLYGICVKDKNWINNINIGPGSTSTITVDCYSFIFNQTNARNFELNVIVCSGDVQTVWQAINNFGGGYILVFVKGAGSITL